MLSQSMTIYKKNDSVRNGVARAQETQKLDKVVHSSRRVLFHAKSLFPFDLFPDEVIIDENKVDLRYGLFFFTSEVYSIPFRNINGAVSMTGPLMGSLTIEIEGYNRNPPPMTRLRNSDATKARRIINGLVTAYKQNIDFTKLELESIRGKVEEIGMAREFKPS